MRVLAVGNQKGGVGKTSCLTNLAAGLAERGHRVLVIDLDPNCGATLALGLPKDDLGTLEALLGDEPGPMIWTSSPSNTLPEGVDVLAAQPPLQQFENEFARRFPTRNPHLALRSVLERLPPYDFVLLDTRPTADTLVINAYIAAQDFLVTTIPEPLSEQSVEEALKHIETVMNEANADLRLLGILSCSVKNRNSDRLHVEEVQTLPGGMRTTIRHSVVVPDAQRRGLTVFQYKKSHPVTDDFRALTEEVLDRLRMREEQDGRD